MNRIRWHNATLCCLALGLFACAGTGSAAVTPSAAATQVAQVATVTNVPVTASPTATVRAAPTHTQFVVPSATASASSTTTATATDSATPNPSSTPTRTPSPRPTRPPATWTFTPTATDSLPDAPLYPKSPIIAWSRDAFLKSIADSRNNTHDFYDYHGRAVTGAIANCFYYWADYANWEKQPGFTGVPTAWYPLYFQLRGILQNI